MKHLSLSPSVSWLVCSLIGLLQAGVASGADNVRTESRMPFRHIIPLRDAAGEMITPPPALDDQGKAQEARGLPYSTAETCGRCHDYPMIGQGWHFNAGMGKAPSGRPGEPWLLTDAATRTQIPVSYRGWNGTFAPTELGLSDYDFLLNFARHHPGGGKGEPALDQISTNDVRLRRFLVTGGMEIDCLICHNRHGDYDHEARYKSLVSENFKWTPTVASELGMYGATRPGKAFADGWRPPRPAPTNLPPIKYERHRFDSANFVAFDVTRRPSPSNCYYCHTSESHLGDTRWHSDGDVHLRAGMSCVDCHRHGIDHMIVRGYEGETADRAITPEMIALRARALMRDNLQLAEAEATRSAEEVLKSELVQVETLSCRGCHYGSEDGAVAGRLGAPLPDHKGLPPIHFEKLSCTACHSGPIPADATEIVQTSMAHKLGLPAPARGENTAPVIVQPAFLKDARGKIAPHKMVWPSYWGVLRDGAVKPLLPEQVAKAAGGKFPSQSSEETQRDPYQTKPLTEDQIREVLSALSSGATNGEAVFVAAGRMYRLEGPSLRSEEHAAAKPYAWALGHDVRPASQSLGAKGCADCHDGDSPIYFGKVAARGPVDSAGGVTQAQWELRGDDERVVSTFAFTFNFRPMLKVITFGCAFIVFGVVLGRCLWWLGGIGSKD